MIGELQSDDAEDVLLVCFLPGERIERRIAVGGLRNYGSILYLAEQIRPPQVELALVEPRLRNRTESRGGRKVCGEDVVRAIGLQAADRRVNRYRLFFIYNAVAIFVPAYPSGIAIDVVASEMVALACEKAGKSTVVRLIGVLQADVGARAGLNPVVPRHLVELEQVGVVEDDAARILVRQMPLGTRALARDDLGDRLDDMSAARRMRDERIGVEKAGRCNAARLGFILDDFEGNRIVHVVERVDITPEIYERRIGLTERICEPPPPVDLRNDAVHGRLAGPTLLRVVPREAERIGVERQLAAEDRIGKDVVVVDDRVHPAFRRRGVVEAQAAEMVEVGAEVVPLAETRQVDLVDAIGLQDIVQLVEAAEVVVALQRHVPAEIPPGGEREPALALDAAAPAIEALGLLDRTRQIRPVLIDGGDLDGVRAGDAAEGHAMAPVALPENALAGQVHGMEGEIVVRRQREVVGHLDTKPEILRVEVGRREEARLLLHRRIGVLEIGHAEDRDAEQLELRILIGDRRCGLVVNDARGADAPQRRHVALRLTGREPTVLELRDVAVAANGPFCGDPRVVPGRHAQRLHEAVAEVVRQRNALAARDEAIRLLQGNVTNRAQRVGPLVVDDLVRQQNVVVEVDLDIAAGDDAVALAVVDQLIALQIERLGLVDRLQRTEERIGVVRESRGRLRLLERVWRGGHSRRHYGRILGAREPGDGQRQAGRERAKAPAHHQLAGRSTSPGATTLRCPRSTHHLNRPPGAEAPSVTPGRLQRPAPTPPPLAIRDQQPQPVGIPLPAERTPAPLSFRSQP